jgi:erythromycin esterase-like protein
MNPPTLLSRSRRPLVAAAAAAMMLLTGVLTAQAVSTPPSVTGWIRHNATVLDTVDPAAPLDDLAPLGQSIGNAKIVGLGESTHGAAEEETLKLRTLRFLVERMSFRSIAWEEDWTTGLQVNEYIRSGKGNPDMLIRQMSPQWQSRQVADVLRWLHDFNAGHAGKVQFFGVEYYLTRPLAYDEIDAYVARTAPERLPDLRSHLRVIRPSTPNMFEYITWYLSVPDKRPYIRHARQVYGLLNGLPHRPGDRTRALALHTARQIVSFYEHYSLPQPPASDSLVYRDAHAAQNLRWWQELTGNKIVYWAASAHTANAPQLRIAVPPDPDWRYPTAGSYLRRWYGQRYLSIGFTGDHGAVSLGPEGTVALPPPSAGWFERPFGQTGLDQFALDLRTPAPPPVRDWLRSPLKTRGLPDRGPGSYMVGGSLAQWFDVIIHRQKLTPVEPELNPLVHGARCSASWLPRTRAGSRDWWSASSSGTPDTVPCALGQLGRAPHEIQHDRAERLQLHLVTGPLEALLEDHGELPLGQDEVVVDVVDLSAGHLSVAGQQGGPGWHAGQVGVAGECRRRRGRVLGPALHHPGYVKLGIADGTHFPVDDRGQPGRATVPEHHVGDLVVAVHEARDVVDRAMSPEPAGRHVKAGEFPALDPLEEGGPPVDLAFVEAIGPPQVVQAPRPPVHRRQPRDALRHLVGERLPGR